MSSEDSSSFDSRADRTNSMSLKFESNDNQQGLTRSQRGAVAHKTAMSKAEASGYFIARETGHDSPHAGVVQR